MHMYSEVEEFIAFLPFTGNGISNSGLKLRRIKLGLMWSCYLSEQEK